MVRQGTDSLLMLMNLLGLLGHRLYRWRGILCRSVILGGRRGVLHGRRGALGGRRGILHGRRGILRMRRDVLGGRRDVVRGRMSVLCVRDILCVRMTILSGRSFEGEPYCVGGVYCVDVE